MSENWFDLVQTLGIVTTFGFTAWTFVKDQKAREISNYLELIKQHREIWDGFDENKDLSQLLVKQPEVITRTNSEDSFLRNVFFHMSCYFEMEKRSSVIHLDGLRIDVKELFTYPKFTNFWEENKRYFNADFIIFVETIKDA